MGVYFCIRGCAGTDGFDVRTGSGVTGTFNPGGEHADGGSLFQCGG